MLMFFTEEDLVSFGNYMVSPIREQKIREGYANSNLNEDDIQNRLKNVSDADLGNWVYMVNQEQKGA